MQVDQFVQVIFPILNKQPTLRDNMLSMAENGVRASRCKVRKVISVPPAVYDALGETLLSDTSLWERIGGAEAEGFEGVSFERLVGNPEMLARFRAECWTNVVAVTDGQRTFFVNSEGYDYARYVGKVAP
jgi:hypothetical protein